MINASIVLLRVLQLVCGIATAALSVSICLYIFRMDRGVDPDSSSDTATLLMLLLLVVPGLLVGFGSYVQARHRKMWGVQLVLLGAIFNLFFIGLNVRFLFLYIGDKFGQKLVLADLIAVAAALAIAVIDATLFVFLTRAKDQYARLMVRGLLGGVLGSLVLTAVGIAWLGWLGWESLVNWFLAMFAMMGPLGAFVGALVGTTMWLIQIRMGTDLRLISRVVVGTIIGMVAWAIYWSLSARYFEEEVSWSYVLISFASCAAATGSLPAFFVGSKAMARDASEHITALDNDKMSRES